MKIPDEVLTAGLPTEDIDDEVLAVLAGSADSGTTVLPERVERARTWEPTTIAEAEWAATKYREAADHIAEVDGLADARIAAINEWRIAERSRAQPKLDYFTSRLFDFAERERAEGRNTTRLPSATISTRKVGAKLVVVDRDALLAWATGSAPEAVKTEQSVLKSKLPTWKIVPGDGDDTLGAVTDDGEPIPGVEVEPAALSFGIVPTLDPEA